MHYTIIDHEMTSQAESSWLVGPSYVLCTARAEAEGEFIVGFTYLPTHDTGRQPIVQTVRA